MQKALAAFLLSLSLLASALPVFAIDNGETAPDFRLPNLEGKKIALADYKGQVVVLKLATTWCPTCKQQTQEIGQIADFLQANNVAVIEVFIQDSEKMVRDYFKEMPLAKNHAVLLDNGKAAKAYNVYVIPRVLLLDRNLKVRHDGNLITGADLKARIGQLQDR
jgi:peroxiredoxin